MKAGLIKTLLACVLSLFLMPVNAETDGNKLFQMLESEHEEISLVGEYYIMGLLDALDDVGTVLVVNSSIRGVDQRGYLQAIDNFQGCKPKAATYGQAIDIVKSYLNKHPEIRHETASILVFAAMREAWPCKK